MSYELRITRQNHWSDKNEIKEIGEDEWRAVVESDSQMKPEGAATLVAPSGDELVYANPNLAFWLGHSNGHQVAFDFRRGNVVVKNPDGPTKIKMRELALSLKGRVQGEEGEFYDDELNAP